MSYTVTLSGNKSIVSSKIFPRIVLEENATHTLGLIDLMTNNTMPNINGPNKSFYIGKYLLEISHGAYGNADNEETSNVLLAEKADEQRIGPKYNVRQSTNCWKNSNY